MNAEVKKQWVDALRSGKYKQGKGMLRSYDDKYCCLGVLLDCDPSTTWSQRIPGVHFVACVDDCKSMFTLPEEYCERIDMKVGQPTNLSVMNDSGNYPFPKIADYIEKEL